MRGGLLPVILVVMPIMMVMMLVRMPLGLEPLPQHSGADDSDG